MEFLTRGTFIRHDSLSAFVRCLFMRGQKIYFVYIMTNRSKTLYTGMTSNLIRRVREHKLGIGSQFTSRYKMDRLVYFERFEDVHMRLSGRKK